MKRRPFDRRVSGNLDLQSEAVGAVVMDFPTPLTPSFEVRSTLLSSSLASLRARGLFERYERAQRSPHRNAILHCVAGEWLPIEVAVAHYSVCQSLGLSSDEQIAIGKDVSKRIHDTFLRLVAQVARGVGVTPWTLLAKGNTLRSRLMKGGGIRVIRLARKSARIELAHITLFEIPYFMNAVLGVYQAGVELLASNVAVRVLRAESSHPERLTVLRIDWA